MRRRSAATVLAGLRKYIGPVERWLEGLPDGRGGVLREVVRMYREGAGEAAEDQKVAELGSNEGKLRARG